VAGRKTPAHGGGGEALVGIVRAERAGILLALAPDMKNLCE
jgi:hypothetical protein